MNQKKINQRAVVFEDNMLLASTLKDALRSLGHDVSICTGSFDEAFVAAEEEACDFAVVDLDLKGVKAYPILDALHERGIAYLLATNTSSSDIPDRYSAAPTILKPYNLSELRQAISQLELPGTV